MIVNQESKYFLADLGNSYFITIRLFQADLSIVHLPYKQSDRRCLECGCRELSHPVIANFDLYSGNRNYSGYPTIR
jgi:hypothetical protein